MRKTRKLRRIRDGHTSVGKIAFVEYDPETGRGKKLHKKPQVGYSCIVGPFNRAYTWMTTPITKVVSDTEFFTINSHYIIEDNEHNTRQKKAQRSNS